MAKWNDAADRQANIANRYRPYSFVQLHQRARDEQNARAGTMLQLRRVYLQIAAITGHGGAQETQTDEVTEDQLVVA